MATNYAQKLQRESQSPKGNVLKNIAYGAKKRLNSDTGWLVKETIKGLPKAAVKVATAPARFVARQIEKDLNFKREMAKPKTPKQIKAAQYKPTK